MLRTNELDAVLRRVFDALLDPASAARKAAAFWMRTNPEAAWKLITALRLAGADALQSAQDYTRTAWFDHRIDYLRWPDNLFWVERGVWGRRHIPRGGHVLDLFCGDGYFSYHFYASAAGQIDAVDLDPSAIAHARRQHGAPNIDYRTGDVIHDPLPKGPYDTVMFFEAIEHLSETDGQRVLAKIRQCLKPGGVLFGSTPILPHKGMGGNFQHDNEFTSLETLDEFVCRVFPHTETFQTVHPRRTTGYFIARRER